MWHGLKSEEPTKKCNKCGRILPISSFNKHCNAKDGLQYHCRDCHKEIMKQYIRKRAAKENGLPQQAIEEQSKDQRLLKVYTHPDLAKFTPRQLMQELKARGFKWEWMLEPQRKIYFDKI